jgi:hypothetical protein
MLFPKEPEVNRTWKTVVEAVITDRLGPTAKVAPDDGKDERLSKFEQDSPGLLRFTDNDSLCIHQRLQRRRRRTPGAQRA